MREREIYLQMFVDFSTFTVLPQQPPEHSHSPQPLDFGRHPGLGGTLTFTVTSVSTKTLGGVGVPCTGTRVNDGGLDDTKMLSIYDDRYSGHTYM